MKKVFLLFVSFLMFCNIVVASDCSENATLSGKATVESELKDPKIICTKKFKDIDSDSYKQKVSKDNKKYASSKTHIKGEYNNLYLIFDRIIRANNLQTQNWRIALVNNINEINAYAGVTNLVAINTSLYDSLSQDNDALAFIISHEIAHLILGHNQITLENNYQIKRLEKKLNRFRYYALRGEFGYRYRYGNGYRYSYQRTDDSSGIACAACILHLKARINKICKQEQELEYIADAEAISLMMRAGYDVTQIQPALNLLSNLPNIYTNRSTHPPMENRISNIEHEIEILDSEYIKNEGCNNIYNSDVSTLKRSSDKKSIILLSKKNLNKVSYVPQTKEDKLLRKAYKCYSDKNIVSAKHYFQEALNQNDKNYIAPLYLSYIYEYEYLNSNNKNDLKTAKYYIKKACGLKPFDKNVLKQKEDIMELCKSLKK